MIVGAVFLLSVTLWLSVTLNRVYTTTLTYPVSFSQIPSEIFLTEIFNPEITVNVKANGLDLIGKNFRFGQDTLQLAFNDNGADFRQGYIYMPNYVQDLSLALGPDIEVLNLSPERVYFSFENKASKKVPLVLRKELRLETSFHLVSPPILRPDSVLISGLSSDLDTIDQWYTEGGQSPMLDSRRVMLLQVLDSVAEISVSPELVELHVLPQPYKEISWEVPVIVSNLPDSIDQVRLSHPFIRYSLLIPSREFLALEEQIHQLKIAIPFEELDPNWPYIVPEPKIPESVRLITRNPLELEFVIVSK